MCRFLDKFLIYGVSDPRFSIPGSIPHYAPNRDFKTEHMKLEFSFDIKNKIVFGKSTITGRVIAPSEKIEFDAVNMEIISVFGRGDKNLKFSYDKSKITINLGKTASIGEPIEISIKYKIINPTVGIYFVGPDKNYPKKPVQIWTHSESEDARYWYPCHDAPHEKFTSEMLITVPREFFAVSNGALINIIEDRKTGNKTYHWKSKYPNPSYLLSFAIGKFSEIKDEWDGIPVFYYCEKGQEEDTKRAFGKTPKMIEFFSKKTGLRYPYEKYAQVVVADFIFGGMEHTTATTQTDMALVDEKAAKEYDYGEMLAAHELAHQWFGDFITCEDWSHAWLNESFATYFEALFKEYDKGKDEFLYEMYQNAKAYFEEDTEKYRRPIVTNVYISPGDIFDRHLYEKGALVLHMIRGILGDELWWKAIKTYVEKNSNSNVQTEDLIKSIFLATGKNMKKLFDQWVYGAGYPEIKASYYWDDKSKEAVIRIAQIQKTDDQVPVFSLPLTIEFATKTGEKRYNENIEENQKQLRYKMDEPPLDVRIDPDHIILKKMTLIKPKNMWLYQLSMDKNVIGRIEASQELAKLGTNDVVYAIQKQAEKETFWAAIGEMALSISTIKSEAAIRALQKMSNTKDVKARKFVALALGEFKTKSSLEILKKMVEDKTSYLVPAVAAKSIGKTRQEESLQILKKNLSIKSWNDVIRSMSIDGIAYLDSENSIPILKEYARPGHHERTRIAAIRNLGFIGKGRKDVLDTLLEMTKDKYALIQLASVNALAELGDERAIQRLEEITKSHCDSRVKRASYEAIRKIYPWLTTDLETAEIKERYEKLKKEIEKRK